MPAVTLYLILGLRIALAWWLVLVAFAALFSGALAGIGGLVLFPPLALLIGSAAAWRQRRADIGRDGSVSPLAVGAGQVIHLALPAAQSLRLAESAIKAVFGAEKLRRTDTAAMARVLSDPGLHRAGLAGLRDDAVSASVAPDGATRSQLLITCAPVHAWLYGVFWVDGGRCARQVSAVCDAVLARMRDLEHAADEHDRHQALQARLSQAELALLRAQVEPHFLFNTLAHIRSSLSPGAEVGRQMLDALIDFLRANSSGFSQAGTALSDELRRVDGYLKLMQFRLGSRLTYRISCSPSLATVEVPTACVLVLAENAIKHGIERRSSSGEITIRCHAEGSALVIEVDNDGPGLSTASAVSQGGLHNLRDRLHLAYAGAAQMTVEERAEGGVRASLRMPLAATGD
jgi:signal transduction histidine kinase